MSDERLPDVTFDSNEYISLPEIMLEDELCAILRDKLSYLGNDIIVNKGSDTVNYRDYIKLDSDNKSLIKSLYADSLAFPQSTLRIKKLDSKIVYATLSNFHTDKRIELWSFERG